VLQPVLTVKSASVGPSRSTAPPAIKRSMNI
jgi:hypothetical protein